MRATLVVDRRHALEHDGHIPVLRPQYWSSSSKEGVVEFHGVIIPAKAVQGLASVVDSRGNIKVGGTQQGTAHSEGLKVHIESLWVTLQHVVHTTEVIQGCGRVQVGGHGRHSEDRAADTKTLSEEGGTFRVMLRVVNVEEQHSDAIHGLRDGDPGPVMILRAGTGGGDGPRLIERAAVASQRLFQAPEAVGGVPLIVQRGHGKIVQEIPPLERGGSSAPPAPAPTQLRQRPAEALGRLLRFVQLQVGLAERE
mmetsp:Transcript_17192/g.49790  ORF Transcript_17192/g.49790 Transcript_17192/m.49790 type:complete len:253 (-) Transcript_17192:607-1365(-)